jgi:bacteriocin-like protein
MKELTSSQLAQVEGGALNGASLCGVAIGLSFFGGPVAVFAAVGFCFLANPSTAS